jgi:DNA-binding NtrC family response regulator
MNKFIAKSESSKKLLNIAQISSSLPVNILITGEKGVGKKILAQNILPDASIFDAKILEETLINKTANVEEFLEIIVTNIEQVVNKKEFLERLINIKVVATSTYLPQDIESSFAVKLDIPPLQERKEDLEELIKVYLKEAKEIYEIDIESKDIDIDLSTNGVSLKKSIFKNSILKSLKDEDMSYSLEQFILTKLKKELNYKDLLEYFEIPLLKAAKKEYKSQLQMANKLQINRITLRKKIDQYSNELED